MYQYPNSDNGTQFTQILRPLPVVHASRGLALKSLKGNMTKPVLIHFFFSGGCLPNTVSSAMRDGRQVASIGGEGGGVGKIYYLSSLGGRGRLTY